MWIKGNYYKAVVWYVTRMHNVLQSIPNTKKRKKNNYNTYKSYNLFETSKINTNHENVLKTRYSHICQNNPRPCHILYGEFGFSPFASDSSYCPGQVVSF